MATKTKDKGRTLNNLALDISGLGKSMRPGNVIDSLIKRIVYGPLKALTCLCTRWQPRTVTTHWNQVTKNGASKPW